MTEKDNTPAAVLPEQIMLRDSGVNADEGQRILTTATGYGYEKCKYIRADVAEAALESARKVIEPFARKKLPDSYKTAFVGADDIRAANEWWAANSKREPTHEVDDAGNTGWMLP